MRELAFEKGNGGGTNGMVKLGMFGFQHGIEFFCLRDSSRESIEDESGN
jgi:hypothetical protein